MRPTPNLVTTKTLLHAYLDVADRIVNMKSLDDEQFPRSPYILYRFQRFMAIYRAFKIPCDPRSFHKGEFIEWESPKYVPILEKLRTQLGSQRFRAVYLSEFFEILLRYRRRVETVLTFSNGVLEASGLLYLAHQKAAELNRIIDKNVEDIDDLLAAIIDPVGKEFTVDELIRDHGYPKPREGDMADW